MISGIYRVTQQMMGTATLTDLQANLDRLDRLQQQLSSGQAISVPSDNPVGTVQALTLSSQLTQNTQYQANAANALSWLGTSSQALTSTVSTATQVRTLVVQAMNTGSLSPSGQAAIAGQIGALGQQLTSLANTTYLGRPVFAGTADTPAAYSTSGAYQGNPVALTRQVGPATTVAATVTGLAAFGAGTAGSPSLMQLVAQIAHDVTTSPSSLTADLASLDTAISTVQSAQSTVGATYGQVQAATQQASASAVSLQASLSAVASVNLPKAIIDLQMQQNAYQAALGVAAKTLQPSLLDFLK
ncbi:MAG: flagellar hook-associated protein FlgL [Actinomycetes bacterium]